MAAMAPEGWRFFANSSCHRLPQLEAAKDAVCVANKASMANPWHNPSKKKRRRRKQVCAVVGSGTSIHLRNRGINMLNKRPTGGIAIPASNNGIQLHSKGECQLGGDEPLAITSEQANAPEYLLGLGELASELGMAHILGKNGCSGAKRKDVHAQCKKPPLTKGDFHRGRMWRIPVPKGANGKELKEDNVCRVASSTHSQ